MVARYEVTWSDYLAAYEEEKCAPPRNVDGKTINLEAKDLRDNFPMTSIKPDEFDCYLTWIRKKTGKPFRLPSEAEWTAIARKATGLKALKIKDIPKGWAYLLGDLHTEWSYTDNDPRNAVEKGLIWRVGQFRPDSLGLYDLFGNAAEAVSDPATFTVIGEVDGKKSSVRQTIFKGGNRFSAPEFDVINGRVKYFSFANSDTVGFRLVYERAR
ncbi:formylglycine-generating enzyme family protein [Sphingomonas sp. QA11]|uniref:formylglycine-generating enzyme family protein n=1 Tax=Sphingomonas sp. QA11 TaxID=2950605 RepID=UPI00234B8B57|nr:SUMF1/EgtB/PvdO family nonheme iron enzyme [Sphingomonas sp. QA11]WCM25841.1 formylglycine-generating enzyme family protein [Sphingomonas sp. QA11]